MRIIDAHAHLGFDEVFDGLFTREELLDSQQDCGVNTTIVQPATVVGLEGVRVQHDAVAALAAEFPGRFAGMACVNPHLPEAAYFEEARRCIKELGFVGLKLHTQAHAVNPNTSAGRLVFESARELGVPVMIHTGTGLPWAAPAMALPMTREYPTVKVVLAHSGFMVFALEALVVANECPNVWLETSWTGIHHVKSFVRTLGAGRVMFGSDHWDNLAVELYKHRRLGLTDRDLAMVLGGTAAEVYSL